MTVKQPFMDASVDRVSDKAGSSPWVSDDSDRQRWPSSVVEALEVSVKLDDHFRASLELPTGDFLTAAAREFQYWILSHLEGVRRRFARDADLNTYTEKGLTRGSRRAKLAYLDRSLIEAILHGDVVEALPSEVSAARRTAQWFNVSRKVVDFPGPPGFDKTRSPADGLVLHISTVATREQTDRLLEAFIDSLKEAQGTRRDPSTVVDCSSHMLLYGVPVRARRRRKIWEVVVASRDDAAVEARPQSAITHYIGLPDHTETHLHHGELADPISDRVIPISKLISKHNEDLQSLHLPWTQPASEWNQPAELLHDRAREDLSFIQRAIERAMTQGIPLDETFVDVTARARLEHVRTLDTFARGGSPTLDSSARIVRSAIQIHLLAQARKRRSQDLSALPGPHSARPATCRKWSSMPSRRAICAS